jgi:hypothetical protein
MGDRSKIERRRSETREQFAAGERPRGEHLPRCSFCGQRRSEVDAMFEGPSAFICNECVTFFGEIIAKRRAGE